MGRAIQTDWPPDQSQRAPSYGPRTPRARPHNPTASNPQATPSVKKLKSQPSGAEPRWVHEALEKREELGMTLTERPWTGFGGIELRGLGGTLRQRETIDIVWAEACQRAGLPTSSMELARDLVCNPTQSVRRCKPLAGKLGTVLVGSRYYWFGQDRTLLSADWLGVMGFPPTLLDDYPEDVAADLVGEAIAVPMMGVMVVAMLSAMNAPGLFADC